VEHPAGAAEPPPWFARLCSLVTFGGVEPGVAGMSW